MQVSAPTSPEVFIAVHGCRYRRSFNRKSGGCVPVAHGDTSRLIQAAAVGVATGVLLAAWGLFVKLNRSAEELEPEAMAEAKKEDARVQ